MFLSGQWSLNCRWFKSFPKWQILKWFSSKTQGFHSKFTQHFCFIFKKNITAWDKRTLTHTHMSRWDRVRCVCPCHGWRWTAWHRWSGKTNAGGRNGQRQKNNIHLPVFPAIFRGAKVCKRGPPPLSEMSVPAAFRGGPHKADCQKRFFLFSPCSIFVINTPPHKLITFVFCLVHPV